MAISVVPQSDIRASLSELDQALYNHEQWVESLYATLICRLAPDDRDVDEEAHRKCRFGQWLYGHGTQLLKSNPGFAEIEAEHERMHRSAAKLLAEAEGTRISTASYDRFITALKRLRLEILTLKRELEASLYNLDPLTGTLNRIEMLTRLREEHALVKRNVHATCIAMLDLDLFKAVNDAFGHLVGDKALTKIAAYTSAHLRPYDKIYRYGGEEFLITLPDTDIETARGIVERIRSELGQIAHEADGRPPLRITVSLGLAPLDPDVPVEQSIDRADRALYAAKSAGRDCTVVWDPSMKPMGG